MRPQTVNASYNPLANQLTFPAAILRPPFFDPNAGDALNYGGIGAVIGHEMTHGYDDQGAKFGPGGNMENGMTAADAAGFKSRTGKLDVQFDTSQTEAGRNHHGTHTLGTPEGRRGGT